MGEDYGYQDPEVEIKESGDVDFVEFADSIADGKDHSVTFYDIAPEGSVMLVYNYDHAQDKLEVISYDENYTEEILYVREHGDVTAGSIGNISAFTENHFRDTFQKIERDEDIPIISTETPEIEEEPMDFQTLLDLEHSQNDEMEEQQNQEIDFGEQQDEIPDERYEGMTSYEEDDLSFLPTAEENMMAEVLSVEGEKPEYVVENPDVHADYGMDKLSPDGQKAIAEAMDKSVMTPLASGFIDFELREGFRGNTDGLTSDDISKLREHDPGFGKIIGIDTTKFYTSGPEKNVTIIKLDYEDIKPALSIDQKGFEKENIVPGSIRAYKEFGQSMKVDGMRFGVTNLVTFEAKLKGEDLPYRTTCVMDDSGRVRGFLEVQEPDRRIPMDLQAKLDAAPGTETHFASLDRTDPENRACIPGLRNATPEIREAFFDKVEAKMPEFMEKFCDNMKEDFLERKDALIAKLDEAKQERDIVHIDLNKVELVRENVLSELADARTGMQDIAEDMNDVMLGYYPVNNKINDVDVKLNREDISKEEKESLEKERADYVKEREEIDQKLDDMKPGFVERYNDYLKISERSELPALDRLSETLSESFLNANGRVEALSMYLERIYGADVDDGEGNLSKTRIMDGLEYGTEFHGEPRFQMVCAWEGQKETLPYQGTFKEYLKENPDLFTEIDSRLEKIVDAYNETAPDTDKITIGEDGQPYTKDGILVEAVTTGKHEDFPKNELEKVYNRDMDTSNSIPPTVDEKGKEYVDTQKIKNHMESPVEKDTRTKAEIADTFVEKGITRGLDKDELRITDQAATGTIKEIIGVAMEVPQNRMNFDKELYSLCKAVDNHGSYEKLPDMEKLKADADSIFKKMTEEEEGPFPDLDRIEKNDTEKKDNGVQSDVSKKDSTSDKVENIFRSKMAGGFGKIDITKDIELSDDKKKEIRVEAEKEAKHSDEPLEKIIERKENEVKDEIRAVAKDIVHYKDVMTKLSALGIPDRYLSRYTPLMRMKLEYDSAIRKAESMGCKVGEDCFIKKSVSILEVRLEQLEYYRSDMPTSRVMEAILGIKTTKDDLYKETVEKDGKTETIEHTSYSKYVAALEPFYAIGGGLGTLLGFLPIYPKEKNDVEKSETQDISGKDMEKEDMPGNEDKIEKPDGEDKTDVPDAHPKEDQISQEKEDIEQPQEQIEIPENDLTASESTGITNDVQNDTVDSKDTEPEHADIEKEKGKEDMPEKDELEKDLDKEEQPDVERYENDTEIEPDEKEDKPESAVDEPEDKKEEQELAVEKPEDTENNIDQKEPNEEQTEIEKPEDKEKIEQDTTDENDHTEKEKPDQVETDNQEIEREENDQPDQKEDTTEFSEKEFPEDDSADSQTDKAEQTEIEKDPEEPEDEDGREEEAHGVTISEKENEEDRVKEDAVASSEMEQKAPQKEDSGIDNQDKNTEKPMDSTDFKEDIRPDEQPDSNEIESDVESSDTDLIETGETIDPAELKGSITDEVGSIFDGDESIDHLLQTTIGDGIADGEIDNTEILEAIADGIADRMDMSDPESVSTASDIVFETMYAVDSGTGSEVPGDTFDQLMDLLGNRGVDSDDLERLSDQVNQTAEDFGKFDTESYGEADGMTLTDDGFTDDITMDDQTDSICSMMVDAMQNIMEDPATMDMDDFEMDSFPDEYEDIDYGVDASDQNFGEQLFDKLEAAGFAPDDPDLPTVDASQDATTMDTMQNFEYPEYDDSQDYDPFENFRDYGSID